MLTFDKTEAQQGGFTLRVNDSLDRGFISVVGPSGSGKSMLLSVIAGFLPVSSGRVLWAEQDISNADPADRPVAMVFQDNNLFPHLSIAQNVALAVEPRLKLRPVVRNRVDEVLNRVGLNGMGDRKPSALSGGQQSRAALARALLADKPIVLLDEPFSALGPGLRQEMLQLVKEVLADRLVIMVTHDPTDALTFGGQTVLVDAGQAAKAQPTQALFDDPPPALRTYLGR